MRKVRLPGWEKPVLNAVQWLRQQENIPDYESVEQRFCEYFGCEVEHEPTDSIHITRVYAVFTEKEATAFLLRWS